MNGARRQWWIGLLGLLVVAQIGCAARSGVATRGATGTSLLGPRPEGPVGVVSGEGRVRVKQAGFVEAWAQETGRCTRQTAVPVGIQTFGIGLIFLPPMCGVMTAALPGMTTQFSAGRMRRAIEDTLSGRDLHSRLRGKVVISARESGRETLAPVDVAPDVAGATAEPQVAGRELEVILEVTVTEVRIRDDGTLSSGSARARLLRASDRAELTTRVFTHHAEVREYWQSALEPALTALAAAIVETLAPAPRPNAAPAGQSDVDLPPVGTDATEGVGRGVERLEEDVQ